jgi:hypothetical protein
MPDVSIAVCAQACLVSRAAALRGIGMHCAIVTIIRPPRLKMCLNEQVPEAIRTCHAAGITVRMITGDDAR